MALGAYQAESTRGSVLNALAHPTVVNPVADLGTAVNTARGIQDLRTQQFNLQQAQLQPGYQAMRMLMATNPNPSNDDVNAALGEAARLGGNVDGIVQNYTNWTARNPDAKPGDFVRAYALGGMSPERQGELVGPQMQARQTAQGTYYGTAGGAWSPNANVFQPTGFVAQGLAPGEAAQNVQVGVNPQTGQPIFAPRGGVNWPGVAGQGGPAPGGGGGGAGAGGAAGGGGGGGGGPVVQPQGPPPGALVQPGQPLSQKDADLAQFAQRESGNQNIFSRVPPPPGYTQQQTGSGYYQIIPSTWAEGQQLAGIPPNQQTQLAIQASPQQQYQVASALYDKYGGRPWAQSAPGGAGGGGGGGGGPPATAPFVGATSAQPVVGGSVVQPGGGGGLPVQPAGGGMQYFPPSPGGGGGGAIPGVGGTPGTYTGYTGLPSGFEQVVQPQIGRANQLQQGLAAGLQTRATLEGMEAELDNLPATGVPSGPLGTLRNLVVSSGLVSQQTADGMAKTQAAQEQFEKFASLLQQQQLGALTGQATDERQALTAASTPSLVHTKLGNLGIIHMLEGNQSALQVMGRSWQEAVSSGQATPQQFDAWRNQFTAPDKNGGRFDPRVFWMAQMGPNEQQTYGRGLTAKDQQQLKRNVQFAEQKGWIFANKDGSFGTSY